jgi:serine/threonine protein kinase
VIDGRSSTFCGTPEYMAPELVQFRSHSLSVDVWALGVLLFEMTTGHAPFLGESRTATFSAILDYAAGARRLSFPWFYNGEAREFITELLAVDAEARPTAADLLDHPFFAAHVDWLALERRELEPPYVPKLESEYDTSNFDDYEEDDDDNGESFVTDQGGGKQPVNTGIFPGFAYNDDEW